MSKKDKSNRRKPQDALLIRTEVASDDIAECADKPKLFWPTYKYSDSGGNEIIEDDVEGFPGIENLANSFSVVKCWAERGDDAHVKRGGEFWKALLLCEEAYIVDKRFSPKELRQILLMLSNEDEVRLQKIVILCQNEYSGIKSMYEERTKIVSKKTIPVDIIICNMNIGKAASFDIHDRFALLDNEIWHFGGTVGGVNAHLTAYSRGWRDQGNLFKRYLDKIVEKEI